MILEMELYEGLNGDELLSLFLETGSLQNINGRYISLMTVFVDTCNVAWRVELPALSTHIMTNRTAFERRQFLKIRHENNQKEMES